MPGVGAVGVRPAENSTTRPCRAPSHRPGSRLCVRNDVKSRNRETHEIPVMRQEWDMPLDGRRSNPAVACLQSASYAPAFLHDTSPYPRQLMVRGNNQEAAEKGVQLRPRSMTPITTLRPMPEFRHALEAERQYSILHVDVVLCANFGSSSSRVQKTGHGCIYEYRARGAHGSSRLLWACRRTARSASTCASRSSASSAAGQSAAMLSKSSTGATCCCCARSASDAWDQNGDVRAPGLTARSFLIVRSIGSNSNPPAASAVIPSTGSASSSP